MTIETLVSAVNQEVETLGKTMNLQTDAIIINQCKENSYLEYSMEDKKIMCYSFCEKGVGLSRNNGLLRSTADIILFADEDIVYVDGCEDLILKAFQDNPQADMLLFNVEVTAERATYDTKEKKRVRWYNSGRYPAYSIAVRREKLHRSNVTFSLLFGGGAKYSNGEDSLFLKECLDHGLVIYALPITIGREVPRPSTWFDGYHEKFFFDRGVLYHFLYGNLKYIMALRFILKYQKTMCQEILPREAYQIMCRGMKGSD